MPRIAEIKVIDDKVWCLIDMYIKSYEEGAISIYTDKEMTDLKRNIRYWLIKDLLEFLQVKLEELRA